MDYASLLPQLIAPAITGVLAFLVRSFVSGMADDLADLKGSIAKIDARFDAIQKDVRDNTVDSAVVRQELKTIWRYIDAKFMRNSINGGLP